MSDQANEQSLLERMTSLVDPSTEQEAPQEALEEENTEQVEQDNPQTEDESDDVETQETEQVEAEEEAAEQNLVELEIDGELYAVPEALKEKFMLQSDYTRKTQELAEQRKQVEAVQSQLQAQAQLQQQSLAEYAQLVAIDNQLQAYQNIDWNALYESDPAEFVRVKEQARDLKENRERFAQEIQYKQQAQMQQQLQVRQQAIEEGQKVLARDIPNWNTDTALTLNKFAIDKFGFTPEEVNSVIDPRVVKLLHTAYQFEKQKSAKPITDKRVKNLPKVSKPTGKQSQNVMRTEQKQLQDRFKRSGSPEDAAMLYLARSGGK